MSFTASVKDELSRITPGCPSCEYALLSGIIRICGSLSLEQVASRQATGMGESGGIAADGAVGDSTGDSAVGGVVGGAADGAVGGIGGARTLAPSLIISTETGVIARLVINLSHKLFNMETYLTVRHSNLHKTRNYMIQIPTQPRMDSYLSKLQILTATGTLHRDVPWALLTHTCCKQAFLRGCFMAGGFIADPRTTSHLEIATTSLAFAQGIVQLAAKVGITFKLNQRKTSIALYIKSFDSMVRFLNFLGVHTIARAFEGVRKFKHVKNDVNRRVNAELANQARSSASALEQIEVIKRVQAMYTPDELTGALVQFCTARLQHPDVSLAELGEYVVPRASKSAMYHRLCRLQELARTSHT